MFILRAFKHFVSKSIPAYMSVCLLMCFHVSLFTYAVILAFDILSMFFPYHFFLEWIERRKESHHIVQKFHDIERVSNIIIYKFWCEVVANKNFFLYFFFNGKCQRNDATMDDRLWGLFRWGISVFDKNLLKVKRQRGCQK